MGVKLGFVPWEILHRLKVFDNEMLRRKFGPERDDVTIHAYRGGL
jgi:hypothetical protein